MGVLFGSVLGGLILAPFTAGTSLATSVAVASAAGTAVGGTAFTVNALANRDAPKGKEFTSFATGLVGGALGPAGGMAAGMGAEVSLGFELAGAGIGIGFTNAGDGDFKPYVGNQQEAVKYYTHKEEKKNYENEVQKERKEESARQLNSYMKKYSQEEVDYFNNASNFFSHKTIKKIYKFCSYKQHNNDSFGKTFDKIQNHFRVYNDDPEVDRVYVIRRKLDSLPFYFGWMAHSGLLLKTKNGRWFICEYGTEADQNKVCLYEVPNTIHDRTCTTFEFRKRKWNKQICGSPLKKKASIHSIQKTMEDKMCKHSYWMLFWNCHIAQEGTREEFGLKVDKKYMDKQFVEEYHFALREL